jgi:DNA-binding GntR family transcriptional regulator
LLAGELAARAASAMDAEQITALRKVHKQLRSAASAGDGDLVEQLNHEFHRTINVAADAPRIAWLLSNATKFAPRRFFATISGWPRASAQAHAAILEALSQGDAALARQTMTRHIENAGELLAVHFDTAQGDATPTPKRKSATRKAGARQ